MIIGDMEFKDKLKFEWELLKTYPWKVQKRDREQLFAIDYLVEETGSCRMIGQNGYEVSTNIRFFKKINLE